MAYPAGGANDIVARSIGNELAHDLGQAIVVENISGAGGSIGAGMAAHAPADGYTLFMAAGAHALAPSLRKELPYDMIKSFEPISLAAVGAYALVVNPQVNARSVQELIALAKSEPGKLNFASSGVGAPPYLAAVVFQKMTGTRMTHVPYRGDADANAALLAGQVDLLFASLGPSIPLIQSGKFRALAVTTAKRSAVMPDLPTLAGSGLVGYNIGTWWGPVDVAFVCVKLYDTDWATALIVPYLSASGFIVTMQNGLIEERVAAFAGWARTVGCVGGGLHLAMRGPGHIHRNRQSGVSGRKVFHVGETHGRLTPRIGFVAEMLEHVDRAGVTTNLWGARWSKLTANCMTSALCGVSGMSTPKLFADAAGQKIMTHLAAQAVTVGLALGFAIDDVFGLAAERWIAAAEGKGDARSQAAEVFQTRFDELADDASSGMAQDFARKRRSEIDYMNGYVANKAAEVGLCVPLHSAMTKLVKKIEAGLASPGPQSLEDLLNATTGD